jgi:asparagine synthase (glutamine-hydrolysing)
VRGLIGTTSQHEDVRTDAFVRHLRALAGSGQIEHHVDAQGRWALGRVHLGVLQPESALSARDTVHVLFHGDLHNAAELRRLLTGDGTTIPALIRGLYEEHGPAALARLDGAYCFAIVDTSRRRTLLGVDRYGAYPLYWTVAAGRLVFGSSVGVVLRDDLVPRQLDPAAVADYVAFGFPLGDKTLAAGVQMVPQGSVLTFDWASGDVRIDRLTRVDEHFQAWAGSRDEYEEALTAAFRKSVGRALSGDHAFGVSLSGGLDSRAILSAMNGQASAVTTYTLGVKGCADEVIADRLARMAGTRHAFYELDDSYLREFLPHLRRMVALTDGMYLSHGLTEMLALGFLESASYSVLVRGHGGELAKTSLAWPFHTDERTAAARSVGELLPYVFDRVNYISPGLNVADLFTDAWAPAIDGAARRSLEQAVEHAGVAPADVCSYLYLTEHHRRSTIASLELFRDAVEVRLPFVDSEFLGVLLRGGPEWRADTSIHRALTAAGNPAMLRVRNSNTGAPAGAGPLTEYALDKVNSLFKRLNVHGFRHYHNFSQWMREQLLSSVEHELLSDTSLQRGVLREAGLRRLLEETRSNQRDHSYLLQVLLILELWQQENL